MDPTHSHLKVGTRDTSLPERQWVAGRHVPVGGVNRVRELYDQPERAVVRAESQVQQYVGMQCVKSDCIEQDDAGEEEQQEKGSFDGEIVCLRKLVLKYKLDEILLLINPSLSFVFFSISSHHRSFV